MVMLIHRPKPPPDMVSHSMVEELNKCERAFYYSRILGMERRDAVQTYPGSTHHRAYELAFGKAKLPASDAAWQAIEANRENLESVKVDLDGIHHEIVTRIGELHFMVTPAGVIQTELKFGPRDGMPYRGYIDVQAERTPVISDDGKSVVDWIEEGCVWDYKVVSGRRSRSQRDADFSPQLALYALNGGVKHAGFVEIRRDLEKPIKYRFTTYSDKQLETWRRWFIDQGHALLQRWRDTHTEDQGPSRWRQTQPSNPLCSPLYCEHWNMCYGCVTAKPKGN